MFLSQYLTGQEFPQPAINTSLKENLLFKMNFPFS